LVHVRGYAGQMSLGAVLGFLLTQVDKLLLSRMLPLEAYGEYVLAGTAAGMVFTLVGPISQACFPRLCQLHAAGRTSEFASTFHMGSQVVSVVVGTAGILLAIRSRELMIAWTGDQELAQRLGPLVSVLAIANTLNGLTWLLYQAQLAHGWVWFGLVFNTIAVCLVVPAMLLVVPERGAIGAAYVWLVLNVLFVTMAPPFVFRRILPGEQMAWYGGDLLIPLGISAGVVVLSAGLFPLDFSGRGALATRCTGEGLLALALSSAACPRLRRHLMSALRRRSMAHTP
jgi:O-antigen/teichoic acid export membrane protein